MSNPEDRVIAVAPGTKLPINCEDPEHTSRVESAAIKNIFDKLGFKVEKYWLKGDAYPAKCLQDSIFRLCGDNNTHPIRVVTVCYGTKNLHNAAARIWIDRSWRIKEVMDAIEEAFGEPNLLAVQSEIDGYSLFVSYSFDFKKTEGDYDYKYNKVCRLIEDTLFDDMEMLSFATEGNRHTFTVRTYTPIDAGIANLPNRLNQLAVLVAQLENVGLAAKLLDIENGGFGVVLTNIVVEEIGQFDLPEGMERTEDAD